MDGVCDSERFKETPKTQSLHFYSFKVPGGQFPVTEVLLRNLSNSLKHNILK